MSYLDAIIDVATWHGAMMCVDPGDLISRSMRHFEQLAREWPGSDARRLAATRALVEVLVKTWEDIRPVGGEHLRRVSTERVD